MYMKHSFHCVLTSNSTTMFIVQSWSINVSVNYTTFTCKSMRPSCSLSCLPFPHWKGKYSVVPLWNYTACAAGSKKCKFQVISEHIEALQSHYLIRLFFKSIRPLGEDGTEAEDKAQGHGREGGTMGSELLGTQKTAWNLTAGCPFPFRLEFPSWG